MRSARDNAMAAAFKSARSAPIAAAPKPATGNRFAGRGQQYATIFQDNFPRTGASRQTLRRVLRNDMTSI
jgi:hypothetical protein